MLTIETINSFLGFSDGNKIGEYFYSQGMGHSKNGIKPLWQIEESVNSVDDLTFSKINHFTECSTISGGSLTSTIYAIDQNGRIYQLAKGGTAWGYAHTTSAQTGEGNGLIVDQNNRLLYMQAKYMGMFTGGVWDDDWKDFGGANIDPSNTNRPADLYEDYVVIGNCNKVALLNSTDDSWSTNALNLPTQSFIKCIKSGKNGVLIGANFNNMGFLVLWDCLSDRSIAPWIWTEGTVKSIAKYEGQWIVCAGNEFFITNGYSKTYLTMPVDLDINNVQAGPILSDGMLVKGHYLFIAGGSQYTNRKRTGLWIYDFKTALWEFCPVSNFGSWDIGLGAIFMDSDFNFHISYSMAVPNKKYIGLITNSPPAKSFFISPVMGKGNNRKTAEGLVLNIGFDLINYLNRTPDWKITAGIYNFRRNFWNYAIENGTATAVNKIAVDGTAVGTNEAEVGDMVFVLEGANAGQIAFVSSIAGKDTASEVWTLDRDLSVVCEDTILFNVLPIKLIGDWDLTSANFEDHYFPIECSSEGKKFLIFVQFSSTNKYLTPELSSLSLIYNDEGTL